jgi:hypothetical protein
MDYHQRIQRKTANQSDWAFKVSLPQPMKLIYGKITKQQNSYITAVQIRP